MAENKYVLIPPDAPAPEEPPSKYVLEPPTQSEDVWKTGPGQTEQDLINNYRYMLKPNKAMTHGAATGASYGMTNRALGLYDYLTGSAPSYGEGVDKRVADEAALAKEFPAAHLTGTAFGGLSSGLGTAKLGLTAMKPGMGWAQRTAFGAAEGLGQGLLQGAGNTYTGNFKDYLNNAGDSAKWGMAIGGAAPSVIDTAKWAAGKGKDFFNYLRPSEDVGRDKIAKSMMDAQAALLAKDAATRAPNSQLPARGVADIVESDIRSAAAAGQPEYSVVDAIGKPAQRQLAVVTKQEGPARSLVDDFTTTRNVNAPSRRAGEIDKALGVEGTAKQAEARLLEKAQTEARPVYDEAMNVGPVHNDTIAEGLADPIMKRGIAHGIQIQRINNSMTGKPFKPTDPAITGFDEAGDPIITGVPNMETLQTAKIGLDQMIEEASKHGPTKYSASLVGFKNRLLEQISALNPKYAEANRIFAGPMQIRDAVEAGQDAARVNTRAADTIDEFRSMPPNPQQGYRIGMANEINAPLEDGRVPALLNPKSQTGQRVLNELSLYQGPNKPTPRGLPEPNAGGVPGENQWRTFMNREDAMARTHQQATGGSSTFENFSDAQSPNSVVRATAALLRGKIPDALGHSWEGLKAFGRGETEAQRNAIAKAMLLNPTSDEEAFAALMRSLRGQEARANIVSETLPSVYRGAIGAGTAVNRRK